MNSEDTQPGMGEAIADDYLDKVNGGFERINIRDKGTSVLCPQQREFDLSDQYNQRMDDALNSAIYDHFKINITDLFDSPFHPKIERQKLNEPD